MLVASTQFVKSTPVICHHILRLISKNSLSASNIYTYQNPRRHKRRQKPPNGGHLPPPNKPSLPTNQVINHPTRIIRTRHRAACGRPSRNIHHLLCRRRISRSLEVELRRASPEIRPHDTSHDGHDSDSEWCELMAKTLAIGFQCCF